eukprot:TRINITY_DN768_c0_g1_i1.p1 TRINITY_DN768_c0_g1~~TRINITY_DN768_c0_g1_i1.p1  ORF type:complete len:283 (-),score=70.55 TRINITY_DN768_c0_g1_i1:158-1006(-)
MSKCVYGVFVLLIVCMFSGIGGSEIRLGGLIDLSYDDSELLSFLHAIDEINANTDLLNNYTIIPFWEDTQCDQSTGLDGMVRMMEDTNDRLSGIMGPGCSVVAEVVASVDHWTVPFVSYGATSVSLSDKDLYPNFIRIVNSDIKQAAVWVDILNHFDIKRVAVLYSSERVHFQLSNSFIEFLNGTDVEVLAKIFPGSANYDMTAEIRDIRISGISTIIIASYPDDALRALSIAAEKELVGFGYTWIASDSWGFQGVHNGDPKLFELLQGVIATVPATRETCV